jgi:hypothetical protein
MTSDATTAVLWSQLPPAEARARLEAFVAGHDARLAGFVAEVKRRGGPADRLDASLESLDPLWDWIVAAHPRGPNDTPFELPGGGPIPEPWWRVHHPPWADELGPYVAWLAAGFADYVFACILAASPGSRWALGRGRSSADFQHPVLQIAGRGEMPYVVPLVTAIRWLGARGSAAHGHPPRKVLELWLGLDAEWEARIAERSRPRPVYAVEALGEDDPFTHVVSFDDVVAHRHERRIAGLLQVLADHPAVEEAVHEDREILYVRAPALSAADLEKIVAGAWSSRRAGSHAARRADVE